MAAEGHGPARVVEPTDSRAFDQGPPQPRDAADHVDHARPGEVDDSGPEEEVVGFDGAGPAVGGPEPVGDDGVDETGEEGGVDEVGDELGALGDGAAGDAGGGDGEGPLVEEVGVVEGGGGDVLQAEEVAADEAVGGAAEGEGEAEEVVEEAASGRVEDVGEHDVHGVLGADGSGAEHGESQLHRKDKVRREEEVSRVNGEGRVREPIGDGGELAADVAGGSHGVGGVGAEERRERIGGAESGSVLEDYTVLDPNL
ncbi:chaperone protein DnaJ [Striga asiatica]|uniref:Chaperone protein DnaJ n=1 Tax=Striga asiatica TaxID=4170 RepID=A0A5A7RFD1_STRAF|nr:chaperone protein DnaJ [Striga asiatica]